MIIYTIVTTDGQGITAFKSYSNKESAEFAVKQLLDHGHTSDAIQILESSLDPRTTPKSGCGGCSGGCSGKKGNC